MKYYFQDRNGLRKQITIDEVKERLSAVQIMDAIDAKRDDPKKEVGYMTAGGFIIFG